MEKPRKEFKTVEAWKINALINFPSRLTKTYKGKTKTMKGWKDVQIMKAEKVVQTTGNSVIRARCNQPIRRLKM